MSAASADADQPATIAGRDLAFLILINLIWGMNLVASKLGVNAFPPVFFTAMRFGSIALFLVPLLRLHRGQMRYLLIAAALTGPVAFSLLFIGVDLVEDASMVAIASQMGVPFSTLLSVWLLGETIRWRRRLGIALAFLGIVVIGVDRAPSRIGKGCCWSWCRACSARSGSSTSNACAIFARSSCRPGLRSQVHRRCSR